MGTGLKAISDLNANKTQVAPEIHKLFNHADESVRAAAAEGMAGVGKNAVPFVGDMAKLLVQLNADAAKAVPELTRLLQHKNDETKRKAHQVLTGISKYNEVPSADRQAFESWQKERSAA